MIPLSACVDLRAGPAEREQKSFPLRGIAATQRLKESAMKLAWILWLANLLPQPAADQLCLVTTVYLEARNQSELGQRAL